MSENKKYKLNTTVNKYNVGDEVTEKEISEFLNIEKCVECGWLIPVTEPSIVPERIIVSGLLCNSHTGTHYQFSPSKIIDLVKYKSKIEQAIENVLNDTVVDGKPDNLGIRFEYNGKPYGWDMPKKEWADWIDAQIHYEKRYTQSEVDAMMERAWNNSRHITYLASERKNIGFDNYPFTYKTFADYKATLLLPSESDKLFVWDEKTGGYDEHFWEQELHKCKINPHYFFTKYFMVDGKPATTRMNEQQFNDVFAHLNEPQPSTTKTEQEKDYRILSFIRTDGLILTKNPNCTFGGFDDNENTLIASPNHEINSVIRVSDNQIIEVGKTRIKHSHYPDGLLVTKIQVKKADDNRTSPLVHAGYKTFVLQYLSVQPEPLTTDTNVTTNNDDVACLSLNDIYHELKMICDGTFGEIDRWNFVLSSEDNPQHFYKRLEQKAKEKLKQ